MAFQAFPNGNSMTDPFAFLPALPSGDGPSPSNLGATIQAKKLYEPIGARGCGVWVEEEPKIKVPVFTATDEFAVLLRMIEERGEFVPSEIVVQNTSLKKVLEDVFSDYSALATEFKARAVTFRAPFHAFFYRWQSYEKHFHAEHDESTTHCLQLLDDIVRPLIAPHIAAHIDIISLGISKFHDLWTIFEPGAEVYSGGQEDDKLLLLESCNYQVLPGDCVVLSLRCKNITWNGTHFGWQDLDLLISDYIGHKNISDLEPIPFKLHEQREYLEKSLTERGRKFVDLAGFHFKLYSGLWTHTGMFDELILMERGRVVIDAAMYKQLHPTVSSLQPLRIRSATGDHVDGLDNRFSSGGIQGFNSPPINLGRRDTRRRIRARKTDIDYHRHPSPPSPPPGAVLDVKSPVDDKPPDEHQLRYCTPQVRGFCLNSKRWGLFSVSKVAEIEFNHATFSRLIMPEDYKELILAFVESKMERKDMFDDVVEGKGRGMIFLLTGQPGVGKTLTAEAVAEEMRRPLYMVSAGDLGLSAGSVETNLQHALDICAKWNCILLVDECDVYLEERKTKDMERNKLVAVFLRLLEYYRGCIFLTTNRVETFDKAFKSRIDLNIHYPNLSIKSKKHIWETFLKPSEDFPHNDSSVTEEELDRLAAMDFNGREIKNLVKTGRLLAARKKEKLGMAHLATVMRVQQVNADAPGLK